MDTQQDVFPRSQLCLLDQVSGLLDLTGYFVSKSPDLEESILRSMVMCLSISALEASRCQSVDTYVKGCEKALELIQRRLDEIEVEGESKH